MRLGYTTNSLIPRLNQVLAISGPTETQKNSNLLSCQERVIRNSLRSLRSIGSSLRTKGQTVTGKFYSTQVISAVENRYIERRPKTGARGIKLLNDNASSHKTKQVANHIVEIGMQTFDHPPYSPNLSPCDFWLFSKLTKHLSGNNFDT